MHRKAIAYLEALIAAAVMGVGMAAGLSAYGAFAQGVAADSETAVATELAAQLAAEIAAQAYEDPINPVWGPESGESNGTRTLFDDVDDYDGWEATPPSLPDGTVLSEFAGYRQQVSVTHESARKWKTITVTITKGSKKRAELTLLRANHDADQ